MKTFIVVLVTVIAIDIVGKGWMLYKRDFWRNPSHMIIDMGIGVAVVIWGAWLLGAAT